MSTQSTQSRRQLCKADIAGHHHKLYGRSEIGVRGCHPVALIIPGPLVVSADRQGRGNPFFHFRWNGNSCCLGCLFHLQYAVSIITQNRRLDIKRLGLVNTPSINRRFSPVDHIPIVSRAALTPKLPTRTAITIHRAHIR